MTVHSTVHPTGETKKDKIEKSYALDPVVGIGNSSNTAAVYPISRGNEAIVEVADNDDSPTSAVVNSGVPSGPLEKTYHIYLDSS